MTLFTKRAIVLVSVFWLMVLPLAARAETAIGTIDVQRLLTKSDAALSVQKQIQARRDKFIEEISKEEQILRAKEKELSELRATLPADEFGRRKEEFEKEFMAARQQAQKRKKALDDTGAKAIGRLNDELQKIVKQIAQERGYTLILSRQDIVLSDDSIDISSEAMDRLNKAVSEIALEATGE